MRQLTGSRADIAKFEGSDFLGIGQMTHDKPIVTCAPGWRSPMSGLVKCPIVAASWAGRASAQCVSGGARFARTTQITVKYNPPQVFPNAR
jgi:hypothetical protein